MTHAIKWLDDVEPHDYPAALSYLSLHYDEAQAQALVDLLREAEMSSYKAKDVLRASQLPHLDATNRHVKRNVERIEAGKPLSPILLIRGQPLMIADGWHRACAVHLLDEDALIPCKIA